MENLYLKISKHLSADFLIGKFFIMVRALLEIFVMLIKSPSRHTIQISKCILKVKPQYTMVTNRNLAYLYKTIRNLDESGIVGDVVECGVWNGGSAALMAAAHLELFPKPQRDFWLFDSFEGLPEPSEKDGNVSKYYFRGLCHGDMNKVERIFAKFLIPKENVHIVPGWFNETLLRTRIDRIALLHIDADWYDSVKLVMDQYFDNVVPGGFVIFDDYGYWEGCRNAVSDFLLQRRLVIEIFPISRTGAYIQKPL